LFPATAGTKHIFIDSVWEEESVDPFARGQQKKAFAVKSMNDLITELSLRTTVSLDSLRFRKTPSMETIDLAFQGYAESGINELNTTLTNTQNEFEKVMKNLTDIQNRVFDAHLRTDPITSRLQQIETDDLHELKRVDVGAWPFGAGRESDSKLICPSQS